MTTRFANSTVAEALTARAAEVAMALLGEPNRSLSSRRELRFRRKGSLAVVVDGAKCGRWYDYEDGLGGDLINLIERVRGVTFREAVAYAEQLVGSVPTLVTTPAPAASARSAEGDSRRNQRRAGNLWREAGPIVGTHAACYLEWRHVLEPALEAGHGVLWFHPNCPFGQDTRHPCLLARCLAGRRFSAGSRAQGIREEYILRVVVQTRVRPPSIVDSQASGGPLGRDA